MFIYNRILKTELITHLLFQYYTTITTFFQTLHYFIITNFSLVKIIIIIFDYIILNHT